MGSECAALFRGGVNIHFRLWGPKDYSMLHFASLSVECNPGLAAVLWNRAVPAHAQRCAKVWMAWISIERVSFQMYLSILRFICDPCACKNGACVTWMANQCAHLAVTALYMNGLDLPGASSRLTPLVPQSRVEVTLHVPRLAPLVHRVRVGSPSHVSRFTCALRHPLVRSPTRTSSSGAWARGSGSTTQQRSCWTYTATCAWTNAASSPSHTPTSWR